LRLPPASSRPRPRIRISTADLALATLAPIAALYLRDALVLSPDNAASALLYCALSLSFTGIALLAFGVDGGIPGYLSIHDVVDVTKVVVAGGAMTAATVFTVTRLQGIPRSVPALQALILAVGLCGRRLVAQVAAQRGDLRDDRPAETGECTVLIGVTKLSALYMRFVESCRPYDQRIVALLDERPRLAGRSMNGVRVYGGPAHLAALIEEFAQHGVQIGRVVFGGGSLSPAALAEVRRVCAEHRVRYALATDLLSASLAHPAAEAEPAASGPAVPALVAPRYFRWQRRLSLVIAVPLTGAVMPLLAFAALLSLIDVGLPIVFWQQRVGAGGRTFRLLKLRTLRPPMDRSGRRRTDEQRLSRIGRLLRRSRLDELPQLFNVLAGDMALIGPRPLLRHDQPEADGRRLAVLPGITGWAQVNGGTLLSPAEKALLDEWYIRNASPMLDLRIVVGTVATLLRGDRRHEPALERARAMQRQAAPAVNLRPDAFALPERDLHRSSNVRALRASPSGGRILLLNRFFHPDESATSQMLSDLAAHLADSGQRVEVVASRQRYGDPSVSLPARAQYDGVAVRRVAATRFGRRASLGRGLDYLSFHIAALRAALAGAEPGDIILAMTDPPLLSVAAMIAARRRGLHLVNWVQDLYPEVAIALDTPFVGGVIGRGLARLRDASLHAAAANLAVGETMATALRDRGLPADTIHLIPNWCDDEDIRPLDQAENPLRREWGIGDRFVVGYSGNLGRAHDVETIVDAAGRLRDRTDLLFLFIGGGSGFAELRRRVAARRLDPMFRFLPYQPRGLLKYSLTAADVHLVSLNPAVEGFVFPSKVYGIAAAGRPIVAIAGAGGELCELVQRHGCGVAVDAGRGERLANALLELMTDPERVTAMGRGARAMLEANFTRRQSLARWDEVLAAVREQAARIQPRTARRRALAVRWRGGSGSGLVPAPRRSAGRS